MTVTPPQVGTVPQDSGYVNDPVCTATGHLLVDSRDFAMPLRLDVVTFRRTYASQAMRPSAFGPGWWSWTECSRGGRHLRLVPVRRPRRPASSSLDATGEHRSLHVPDLDLDRGIRSTRRRNCCAGVGVRATRNQQWTFRDGLLVEVTGPFIGTTSLRYSSRRLTRSFTTAVDRWRCAGSAIASSRSSSSDGRRAGFTYNPAGVLVAVDNATSPETYEVDDIGRILSITDADGVRTVAMVYDDEGRVVAQTSATGFTTRFDYDAVRRTTLSDPEYNPLSVYTHDERGRVEMYATGGGFRFSRRFDELGRGRQPARPRRPQLHARRHRGRPEPHRRGALVEWRRRALRVRRPRPPRPPELQHLDDGVLLRRRLGVALADRARRRPGLAVDLEWQLRHAVSYRRLRRRESMAHRPS